MTDAPDDAGPFRILFVCTGNTCRSPMAAAIARRRIDRLRWRHVEIASAGVGAFEGSPASGGALRTTAQRGLDLGEHAASLLTPERVEGADLILTMSPAHLARVVELGGAERAAVITEFAEGGQSGSDAEAAPWRGVPDPIGGSDEEYDRTFEVLDDLVARALVHLETVVKP